MLAHDNVCLGGQDWVKTLVPSPPKDETSREVRRTVETQIDTIRNCWDWIPPDTFNRRALRTVAVGGVRDGRRYLQGHYLYRTGRALVGNLLVKVELPLLWLLSHLPSLCEAQGHLWRSTKLKKLCALYARAR